MLAALGGDRIAYTGAGRRVSSMRLVGSINEYLPLPELEEFQDVAERQRLRGRAEFLRVCIVLDRQGAGRAARGRSAI